MNIYVPHPMAKYLEEDENYKSTDVSYFLRQNASEPKDQPEYHIAEASSIIHDFNKLERVDHHDGAHPRN